MQNPCVAEKCAHSAGLRWMSFFKWLVLGLLLLLFFCLRGCGLDAIKAPSITHPTGGAVEAGTLNFTGVGAPNSSVEIVQNGVGIGKVAVDNDGNWMIDHSLSEEGEYEFVAQSLDAEGQVVASSKALFVTIPAVMASVSEPVIIANDAEGKIVASDELLSAVSSAEAAVSPVINFPRDEKVEIGLVRLEGMAEPKAILELLQNDKVIRKISVDNQGKWQASGELVDTGTYTYVAQTVASNGEQVIQSNIVVLTAVDRDIDNDGVSDNNDLCPNTGVGLTADKLGCAKVQTIVLDGVNFKTNSAKLTTTSLGILDQVVKTLSKIRGMTLEVLGHTDSDGGGRSNLLLSQKRAEVVLAYLKNHGVDTTSMKAKGYGESKPIASNSTAEGKSKNRRVELNLL